MYNRKDFWQLSETKGLGHGTADFQAKKKKAIKENGSRNKVVFR